MNSDDQANIAAIEPEQSDEVLIVATRDQGHLSLTGHAILEKIDLARHPVVGDGNCLYHAVAHHAGFEDGSDCTVSKQMRGLVVSSMARFPGVQLEEALDDAGWEEHRRGVEGTTWGTDVDIRLLALGLSNPIVTVSSRAQTHVHVYPCGEPGTADGGIVKALRISEFLHLWKNSARKPYVIIFNRQDHFDSTRKRP